MDNEDFEELSKYKWCAHNPGRNTYYAISGMPHIRMHRHILGLTKGDKKIVDHINKNGLDNRRANLRVVNTMENARNHMLSAKNTSGHTGVCWSKENKKWKAEITTNYKLIHLGYFDKIRDAIKARQLAEKHYWIEGNCYKPQVSSNNTSGYTGVYWCKDTKKWLAQIYVNYKGIHLGYFDDIEDAITARRLGEYKYWGEEICGTQSTGEN